MKPRIVLSGNKRFCEAKLRTESAKRLCQSLGLLLFGHRKGSRVWGKASLLPLKSRKSKAILAAIANRANNVVQKFRVLKQRTQAGLR